MLRLFKRLTLTEWLWILLDVVFIAAGSFLELKIPDYTKEISMLVQSVGKGAQMSQVWQAGGYMIACALGGVIASLCAGFCSAKVAASFSKNMRRSLFEKVQSFGRKEINNFSTSSLITRSINDVTQVSMLIAMGLHSLIKPPFMLSIAIINISQKNVWQWSVATAGAGLSMIILLVLIIGIATPRFKKMQKLIDDLNRDMRENLTGLKVVRAYNAEGFQERKFEKSNEALTSNHLVAVRTMAFMNPIMNIVNNGLTLSVYWLGIGIISSADMADKASLLGDMITFSNYATHVVMSFMVLAFVFMMLPRATVSAKRIREVLETESSIQSGAVTVGATDEDGKPLKGVVEFKNVSFKYPDAEDYILHDVSFVANAGETVAFIGSTGSGKSTLINLVPRFFDATEGQVLVDGVDVRDYETKSLNNKLGYVRQKAVLFSGTVAENIAYGEKDGPPPTREEIAKAAKVAQCEEFIEKMPNKYEEHIAQGGTNVSGGQKQRLSIARAVARNPEIYIFDDSFSALDFKTDKLVRQSLKEHARGSTMLIVAQRIGTIRDADKIVVLQEGRVVGIGKHEQLIKDCEVYREIALSQFAKEEIGL